MHEAALTRAAGFAALTGGALRIASAFIPYAAENAALEALYSVIDACLLMGLIGVYAAHAPALGRIGFMGFGVAALGVASIVGPDAATFGVDWYAIGASVFVAGLALLAVQMLRARVLTSAALAWLGPFASGLAVPLTPYAFMSAGLLLGLGYVLAGYALTRAAQTKPAFLSV